MNQSRSPDLFLQFLFVALSGAIFSISYAIHSDMSGSISRPETLATFAAHWPYRPRFLTAWISYKAFGPTIINSVAFRAALAFVCWVPSAIILIRFAKRLQVPAEWMPIVFASFVLIMLAHYCLPNIAAPYYIYDMPAILFYLIAFMLLTQSSLYFVALGAVLTWIFTMNREPVSVAIFHAFAWWATQHAKYSGLSSSMTRREQFRRYIQAICLDSRRVTAIAIVCIAFVGTLVMRQLLVYFLDGSLQGSFFVMLYEGDEIRLLANLRRIATELGNFQQFVATGFGAVFYIPAVYKFQNTTTKALMVISLLPLVPLVFVGNFFTELRIYGEYVPLLSCLLAAAIRHSFSGK